MKQIVRSMFYQMKIGYLWKKIFVVLLLFIGACMSINIFLEEKIGTVTMALAAAENKVTFILMDLILVVAVCAEICGNDFQDRTINHELLGGHSRAQVYFGRAFMGIVVSEIGGVLLLLLPMGLFSALGYHGDTLKLPGLFLRLLLLLFVLYRFSCAMVFLTCILKNSYLSMLVGGIWLIVGKTVSGAFMRSNPYLLCITNAERLFDFSGWFTYSIKDLQSVFVYDSMPDAALAAGTVSASLLIGTALLLLGYEFFRKDDLR